MVTSGFFVWKSFVQAPCAASCALEPAAFSVPLRDLLPPEPLPLLELSLLAPQALSPKPRQSTATVGTRARNRGVGFTFVDPPVSVIRRCVLRLVFVKLGRAGNASSCSK